MPPGQFRATPSVKLVPWATWQSTTGCGGMPTIEPPHIMKLRTRNLYRTLHRGAVAAILLHTCSWLQAGVAVLELERSTDAQNWQKVILAPSSLNATGGVLQNTHDPKALYRLRIRDDQQSGFITAIPLTEAPGQAVEIAKQFVSEVIADGPDAEGGDPEGGWIGAELGPICYPVYDPAVDQGRTPAYLEFKLVRAAKPSARPSPNNPLGMSPPDLSETQHEVGYLLVSLTQTDSPVPSFGQEGPTPVETLLRKARTDGPVKAVRLDEGLLVGENPEGEIVASLGNAPISVDPKVLEIVGKEFTGGDNGQGVQDDNRLEFPVRGHASYREFKADLLTNPFYAELRRLRAKNAALEWRGVLGDAPKSIVVPLNARTLLFDSRRVRSAELSEPGLAALTIPTGRDGLWVTGVKAGGALLEVVFEDGSFEHVLLHAGTLIPQLPSLQSTSVGWTAWKYWYAGSWSDQRRYKQYQNDPQMCTGGASGCGPAAWAMLYGWWDRKGSPRLLKNTTQADSPLHNDDSVLDCNRYVFDEVGPFCVNGQAATMPWNMKHGAKWAQHRNAGRDITWTWGVPYASPGSVSKAADAIKAGRPAIVGLGFYWHYPLAYGYKGRQYKTGSIVWNTQRYFKCNMGWGGDSAQWHNASSTWFATHARYW
jgi:hypothetical protein